MKRTILKLLDENRDAIIDRWSRQVLRKLPVYKKQPISQLERNIESGIDSLVDFLTNGRTTRLSETLHDVSNIRLVENFILKDVLSAILEGKTAIAFVASSTMMPPETLLQLHNVLDEFFNETVVIFSEIFQELQRELTYLKSMVRMEYKLDNIIGKSKKMREVFELLPRIADSPTSILVKGKSGTGKELIAKYIHFHSGRRNGNFVAINCSALPENLLESEMFGYVRGAFTGAAKDKDGLFQEAEGGTVFLDEIGDMSLALQAKLLRVLQEKEYKKVGGTKIHKADVRVISATNKDLEVEMANERFREDLYYRVNVIAIQLPELRERKEDIPLLVKHFIAKSNKETARQVESVGKEAMKALMEYDWPGNVRELENAIERAVILCGGKEIQATDLCATILDYTTGDSASANARDPKSARPDDVHDIEKRQIIRALTQTHFHRTKTAEMLGINRKTPLPQNEAVRPFVKSPL